MRLQFIGCGDAFGSGGRFNTCFRLERESGGDILIDCGASSLIAMRQLGVDPNGVETIVVSHLHGDHFGGLPFFILDGQFYSRRTAPLMIVGPPGLDERLTQAMEVFFPGSSTARRRFETEVREVAPGGSIDVGDVRIEAIEVKHACGAPPLGLRLTLEGKTIAYSGDSEWTDALVDVGRGADLFVVEALSYDKAVPQHLDYAAFRANATRIGAKRVVLTHMGPDMLARLADAEHEAAADGKIIAV
ncbi:MAG TPA: MBL fold metallo-hydrolase [Caulobacteraceae bacterium]|nr:MBL fold metallo-hydrolase [Caulobacteraceae bacterium]